MKLRLLPSASLLTALAALPAVAVTETWDGGGADNNLTTGLNWLDNSAPASDLANTDLIFAGTVRNTGPVMPGVGFSTRSITFDNTAGAFTLTGGNTFVGAGGIVNNDSQAQTINTLITFATGSSINAAAGPLNFGGGMAFSNFPLAITTATGTSQINSLSGGGTLTKTGAGELLIGQAGVASHDYDLVLNGGTVSLHSDANLNVNTVGSIAINSGAYLANGNLTLNGGQLTRASGQTFTVAAGRTFAIQFGGDAVITGPYNTTTSAAHTVSGAGSTFSLSSGSFNSGSSLAVSAGGLVQSPSYVDIGASSNGTLTVDGTGSSFSVAGLSYIGQGAGTGTATYTNGATGSYLDLSLAVGGQAATNSALSVQSGSSVAVTGSLSIGTANSGTSTVTVAGSGSVLNLTGGSGMTIGGTAGTNKLVVGSLGTFQSGTAASTVNQSGRIEINGGTYLSSGDLTLQNGGQLTRAAASVFSLAAGATLNVQSGADFAATGAQGFGGGTVNVSGTGSTLTVTGGGLGFHNPTTTVSAGGVISTNQDLNIGNGIGTVAAVNVDGAGSQMNSSSAFVSSWGSNSGIANVTFSNGSTGSFGQVNMGLGGGIGSLVVDSGASVNMVSLLAAAVPGDTAFVNLLGSGSALSISNGPLTIGSAMIAPGNSGQLDVASGSAFTAGVSPVYPLEVQADGQVQVHAGGTLSSLRNISLAGGSIFTDPGATLNISPGLGVNITSGGLLQIGGTLATPGVIYTLNAGAAMNAATFRLNGGSTFTAVSSFTAFETLEVGHGSNATMSFTNEPNSLQSSGSVSVADNGGTAQLQFASNAGALLHDLTIGSASTSGGASGTVLVSSGADVEMNGTLTAGGGVAGAASGNLTVTGAGSTFTHSGGGAATIGSGAHVTLSSGGSYFSSSGTTTVNTGGNLNINAGGNYFSSGTLHLNGGTLTRDAAGVFDLTENASLQVTGGGTAAFTGSAGFSTAGSSVLVSGAGSSLTATSALNFNNAVTINAGGVISGSSLNVGPNAGITVSGAGSQLNANPSGISVFGTGGTSTVTFANGGGGTYGRLDIASGLGSDATTGVLSGASITAAGMTIGDNGNGTLNVGGAGSTVTISSGAFSGMSVGGGGSGTVNITSGGTVSLLSTLTNSNDLALNPGGTVNVNGGSLLLGDQVQRLGGTINYITGRVALDENLTIGASGLLGGTRTLTSNDDLSTTDTFSTTIDPLNTLTLDGGRLSTGSLVNNGTLDFRRGTLAITGAGGFSTTSTLMLGAGANLQVTNAATIASTSTVQLNGGTLSSGSLTNNGTLRADLGTVAVTGSLTNPGGGRLFAADRITAGTLTNQTGGRVTLEDGTGIISATTFSNSGILTGDGTVSANLTNNSGGEIRGEAGKTLTLTGTNGTNAGRINLLGGTVQFTQPLTNGAGGQINGSGALYVPTTPVPSSASPSAGLNNSGLLSFSGGDTQVFGTVQMNPGSRLVTSGGATVSFYDVFRHNGAEVKASFSSSLVFFGEVRGAGSFSGTGTVYMEGGYSPGNSPASVVLDAEVVLGEYNTLTLEIGGESAGTEFDQILLGTAGSLHLDGTLVLDVLDGYVPRWGQVFQVLGGDGEITGAFDSIIARGTAGSFDTSSLASQGIVRFVPEPGTAALALAGLALGLRRRRA